MGDKNNAARAPVPVYLVRHGITHWNREGLVQGWTDIPLSETGRAQAGRLAESLSSVRIARIITSNLCRATETASIIAERHNLLAEPFSELREYGCGAWEGRPYLEVRATEKEAFRAWFNDPNVPMPGGESMATASRRAIPRVRQALGEMASDSAGVLLIVAHGGINRLIAADLLGFELDVAKKFRLDNASVSILEPFLGTYALKLWNSVAHLDGLADADEEATARHLG